MISSQGVSAMIFAPGSAQVVVLGMIARLYSLKRNRREPFLHPVYSCTIHYSLDA